MFANLERETETFNVEVLAEGYLLRGNVKPLGGLVQFMNDRRRNNLRLEDVELYPLAKDRQMPGVKRERVLVNKQHLTLLSIRIPEDAEKVQILASQRPVIFYLGQFAVQGRLHVNVDVNEEDLLDETRDFYPVSEATVFPVRAVTVAPTQKVPLLFIGRPSVLIYHVYDG